MKNGKHSVVIHSLQMCATGDADMCRECCFANQEDCSQQLTKEAANALELYYDEEDEDYEESDWDREMGFDPYEGLYTYDC